MEALTDRFKVWIYFFGRTIKTNNFTFEVKVILDLESTFANDKVDK